VRQELIVLVDEQGKPIGTAEKFAAHNAHTPLHLAFSCYVFNDRGELLVTQRALSKKVWPGVWTNSVCGHPAPDEAVVDAIKRRLEYELGMQATDFQVVLPNYRYKTPPFKGIIENEICPVHTARAASLPKPNPNEVEAIRWMTWSDFVKAAKADTADVYSYWCKDQLQQLENDPVILKYSKMIAAQ
jgi:isopentenyl-diphosphate Delta-isomerase